jgi:hypothetical protein
MSFTHHTPPPIQETSPKHTSPPTRTISNKLQVTISKIPHSNGNSFQNSKATTNKIKNNMTSSSQQKQHLQPSPTTTTFNATITFAETLSNSSCPKKEHAIIFDAVDEVSQIEYIK